MNATVAAQRNPTAVTAWLLALGAMGLFGYVLGGWLRPAAPAIALGAAAKAGPVVAALTIATALLLAAAMLMRRVGRSPPQPAMRDLVSGLYSQRYAAGLLPGLMARDDRAGRSQLALVRVGIDCIDQVRCRYGRLAVEQLLGSIGRHIRSQTREGDLPTQPDEQGFAVFLNCGEVEQAEAFCRRLSTLLRSEQMDWQGDVIKVSPSMGVAIREIGESLDQLQVRALQKLAAASDPGSARIVA